MSRSILLCGDIHGSFDYLRKVIYEAKDTVIQLGDLGIGFPYPVVNPAYFLDINQPYQRIEYTNFEYDPRKFRFIRGNHDKPLDCRAHKNYLGEYGVFKDVFYISGARSIDREFRKEGKDWWPDEELSIAQGYEALEMYKNVKPDIVMSHECPHDVLSFMHSQVLETRTGQLLNAMYHEHHPKQWYFAHHHVSFEKVLFGTHFKCLNVGETVRI